MNHGRRKQEQPGEHRQGQQWGSSAPPPLPNAAAAAPCFQDLGFCRDKAKKLEAQISPQRSLMAGRPKRDQTRLSVCSLLVKLWLGAELTLDLAPPLTQLSWETT